MCVCAEHLYSRQQSRIYIIYSYKPVARMQQLCYPMADAVIIKGIVVTVYVRIPIIYNTILCLIL